MQPTVTKQEDLQHRWEYLDQQKSSIVTLCEEYAQWTLPYIFPPKGAKSTEMQVSSDSIGAQGVNHLANKVVSTLFPPQRMFFRLHLDQQMKQTLKAALMASTTQAEGGDIQGRLAEALAQVETVLAETEQQAQDYMDMVMYRPQATMTGKLLIITGNALVFHPEGRPVQVYNIRDYCVVRDLSGEVIEIMTRETKAFETFHPDVQSQLRAIGVGRSHRKDYDDKSEVTIYSQLRLMDDGKFHLLQAGDHMMLDTAGAFWPKETLPWIPLTWNLVRGEDYGRGLVADYAGAFHAVNVLSSALLNLAAIMGDVKFMVNPASTVDLVRLNNSPAGSYHSGKPDDVAAIQLNKQSDAEFIAKMIERYERQIAQAFLLNSQLTRQAERVTAEEVRQQANELEMSNGGIYSRLAATWQGPTAFIVLDQIKFEGLQEGIKPKVITGMDSLSRTGELDNLRLFMMDLQMLNTVPEDVRAGIDVLKFMALLGQNRQVDYTKFLKTMEQMQAQQQAEMAAQQQQVATETQGAVAAEAGKAAVQQQEQ